MGKGEPWARFKGSSLKFQGLKEDLGEKPEEQNLERQSLSLSDERRVERAAGSVKAQGALMRTIRGHPEKVSGWGMDGVWCVKKASFLRLLSSEMQRNEGCER